MIDTAGDEVLNTTVSNMDYNQIIEEDV